MVILPQQANINIKMSLSVYLQQTNGRGPIFWLVAKQLRIVMYYVLFVYSKIHKYIPNGTKILNIKHLH